MAPARLKVTDKRRGTISVGVSVEEASGSVVRLLSVRPFAVGSSAELANAAGAWKGRVSRCNRAMTGLYELSLALTK